MEIQTKHRVELLNAKCEVVNKLYAICKKSEYGDVDKCCLDGMYAKVKLIHRLDCYCFPDTTVTTVSNTIFKGQTITATNSYAEGTILYMSINGVLAATQVVTVANLFKQYNFYQLLVNSGVDFDYHQVTEGGSSVFDASVIAYYVIRFACTVNNISFQKRDVKGGELSGVYDITTFFQDGVCSFSNTTCYNCIEDTDLTKMYEVLKRLGK